MSDLTLHTVHGRYRVEHTATRPDGMDVVVSYMPNGGAYEDKRLTGFRYDGAWRCLNIGWARRSTAVDRRRGRRRPRCHPPRAAHPPRRGAPARRGARGE